jgi:hypothetical protein
MEIWKDIPNYEGLYQVSNFGRVKSLERVFYNRGPRYLPETLMLFDVSGGNPYRRVKLSKNGRYRRFGVHVLVALCFIGPRPTGYSVLHGKEGKFVNTVENLSYGTHKQNMQDKKRDGTQWQLSIEVCPWGHPYSGNNLNFNSPPHRRCFACQRARAWLKRYDGDHQELSDLCFKNNMAPGALKKAGLL